MGANDWEVCGCQEIKRTVGNVVETRERSGGVEGSHSTQYGTGSLPPRYGKSQGCGAPKGDWGQRVDKILQGHRGKRQKVRRSGL